MNFDVPLEFRKRDKRQGKNSPYLLLKFEDPSSGDDITLYSPLDREYLVDQFSLKKGSFYKVTLDYSYNRYDRAWRMDIVDIIAEITEEGEIVES